MRLKWNNSTPPFPQGVGGRSAYHRPLVVGIPSIRTKRFANPSVMRTKENNSLPAKVSSTHLLSLDILDKK